MARNGFDVTRLRVAPELVFLALALEIATEFAEMTERSRCFTKRRRFPFAQSMGRRGAGLPADPQGLTRSPRQGSLGIRPQSFPGHSRRESPGSSRQTIRRPAR